MSQERTIDELIDEFNAKAKAEGRYDGRAFWEVAPRPGSILDVAESAESRERVAWLLQRIAELKGAAAPAAGHVRRPIELPLETWQKLDHLAEASSRSGRTPVSAAEVAAAIIQQYVATAEP